MKLKYIHEYLKLRSKFTNTSFNKKEKEIYEVSDEEGKYLLKTFPTAFEEIKEEKEAKKVTKPRAKKKVEKEETKEQETQESDKAK